MYKHALLDLFVCCCLIVAASAFLPSGTLLDCSDDSNLAVFVRDIDSRCTTSGFFNMTSSDFPGVNGRCTAGTVETATNTWVVNYDFGGTTGIGVLDENTGVLNNVGALSNVYVTFAYDTDTNSLWAVTEDADVYLINDPTSSPSEVMKGTINAAFDEDDGIAMAYDSDLGSMIVLGGDGDIAIFNTSISGSVSFTILSGEDFVTSSGNATVNSALFDDQDSLVYAYTSDFSTDEGEIWVQSNASDITMGFDEDCADTMVKGREQIAVKYPCFDNFAHCNDQTSICDTDRTCSDCSDLTSSSDTACGAFTRNEDTTAGSCAPPTTNCEESGETCDGTQSPPACTGGATDGDGTDGGGDGDGDGDNAGAIAGGVVGGIIGLFCLIVVAVVIIVVIVVIIAIIAVTVYSLIVGGGAGGGGAAHASNWYEASSTDSGL